MQLLYLVRHRRRNIFEPQHATSEDDTLYMIDDRWHDGIVVSTTTTTTNEKNTHALTVHSHATVLLGDFSFVSLPDDAMRSLSQSSQPS